MEAEEGHARPEDNQGENRDDGHLARNGRAANCHAEALSGERHPTGGD